MNHDSASESKIEEATEAASKEVEKKEATAEKAPKGMIQAPDYCRFQKGEIIPLKGYRWQMLGYTDDFMMVLKCVGPTGKEIKKKG
jgi:hypothetical protein